MTEQLDEAAVRDQPPVVRVGVQVIVRSGSEVLLVQRARGYGTGLWGLPGGHLEVGETIEQCALRELAEESSLVGSAASLVALLDPVAEDNYHMQIALAIGSWHGTPRIMDRRECSAVAFRDVEEVRPLLFPPTRRVLAQLDTRTIYGPAAG